MIEGFTKFERFVASWMRHNQRTKTEFRIWFGSVEFEQRQREYNI